MFAYRKFGIAAATAAAALMATAGSAAAHQVSHDFGHWDRGGAVFVQTDNLAGNAIAVYDRQPGGKLTAAGTYATGGLGGQLAGSVVDHLASQNSLVYDAQVGELFAVNAGSNTVSGWPSRSVSTPVLISIRSRSSGRIGRTCAVDPSASTTSEAHSDG